MKRSPLNRVSKKRSKLNVERREFVREFLEENPLCQAQIEDVCRLVAVDVHEILTRARGGSIVDPDNCLALCRACHRFITDNPAFSNEQGFTVSSWSGPAELEAAQRARWDYLFRNE
jgi:hypothetical protein